MLVGRLEAEDNYASNMILVAALDRFAGLKQHYVNKMEDTWIVKEMMNVVEDVYFHLPQHQLEDH